MNDLKQNLVGRKVRGSWAGYPYTGVITESIQNGEDFNHIIQLDRTLVLTWEQLGYGSRYKRYQPWRYTHLNHNTERSHLSEPGRHVVELVD